MSNERTPSPTSARDDRDKGPLFGRKGAVIVAITLGVMVILLVITYSVGSLMRNLRDPKRYIANLQVTIEKVAARSDTSHGVPTVEVIGTIRNQGDRDVEVTLEILLKDKYDLTVGWFNRDSKYFKFIGSSPRTFQVRPQNSKSFQVQIEPTHKDFVPEKTVARIVDLFFSDYPNER